MIAISLGYFASLLLAVSLIVNNDLRFRWLNTFGCISFICYGILIHALPVLVTNSLLLCINVFYLFRLYKASEQFEMIDFAGTDPMMHKFIQFYETDIHSYFPEFKEVNTEDNIRFAVLRDMVMANVFLARLIGDGTAIVHLNYTVAKYRDFKVGRYIFEEERAYLLTKGVKRLKYEQPFNKKHERFLKVMGFRKTGEGWVKEM